MSAISFRHKPEFGSYVSGTEHTVDLLITVIAESEVDSGRAALRVSAALDRSGSMSGRKLSLVKRTMNFVLRQVEDTDKLGIVSYGTTVTEELGLIPIDSEAKRKGAAALEGIRSGQMTNLSGGLFHSISQVKEDAKGEDETNPGPVNCVLLLTDGLPNEGVSDPDALEAAVVKALEGYPSIKLHTFGFGPDHDANLLQRLAEIGGGNFYFINDDDSVPTAFADAIGGLLSVVVQNVSFDLRTTSDDIQIERVFTGFKTERKDDGSVKILCNDLYSKERKDVIVRLKVPAVASPLEAQPVLEACLKYFDVSTGQAITNEAVVSLSRPQEAPSDQTADEELLEQRLRVNVYETMEGVAELAARGENQAAAAFLRRSISHVQAQPVTAMSSAYAVQLTGLEENMMAIGGTFGTSTRISLSSDARNLRYQRGSKSFRTEFQSNTIKKALKFTDLEPPSDGEDPDSGPTTAT